MNVTGLGSLMNVHAISVTVRNADDLVGQDENLKRLFFFDMLEEGIYLARRGLIALSLPIGNVEAGRLMAAVKRFIDRRKKLLV